jgi:hypothetical protein
LREDHALNVSLHLEKAVLVHFKKWREGYVSRCPEDPGLARGCMGFLVPGFSRQAGTRCPILRILKMLSI